MLTELTDHAFATNGPVRQVLGQHRPTQAAMAHEFAAFIEAHRGQNRTTVSLAEQRGGLGKTAAYTIVLMLHIALTGERAAYATFTRALRNSIKESAILYNRIVRLTLASADISYTPINIVEYQSLTAFVSPTKCDAIRKRLEARRIPFDDVPEVQEFLDCADAAERPCEFADLYSLLPVLPCGWSEMSLALGPQDRDTDDWQTVQSEREQAKNKNTLVLLTHAMVIRNNLRRGKLFGDDDGTLDVKTLVIDEADKLPSVANSSLRVTVSRNELNALLEEIQGYLDRPLRAEGERILARGMTQLASALGRVNFSCGKDDPPAVQISHIMAGINNAFTALFRQARDNDALIGDRIRQYRDNVRALATMRNLEHPILHIARVTDPEGNPDINLTLEIGGGRRLISQMWRDDSQLETVTLVSALMTNMPPYATRYDRFRRDIDLNPTQGDRVIERPPLQPAYGRIGSVVVADRLPKLLPTDQEEANFLRKTSLDALAKQITTCAERRNMRERVLVLFQSYVAMHEVFERLPAAIQQRVVMRHRRHLSDAVADFAERRGGIWFGVDWEGINFVHPSTRRTMVDALVVTRLPLAPRDEIRVMRLSNVFGGDRRAESVALNELVHAAYRKLYHGLLLGIRNERDVINELWILDPRWPLPAYVYQRQPPQVVRSIAGQLFNHFDRIIESYNIDRWYKVDEEGNISPLMILDEAAD